MSSKPLTREPPKLLAAIVEQLFPSAGMCRASRRPSGSGSTARKELLLVPNASRPRLVLPAGRQRVQAAALLRFSDALSWRDRAARIIGAAALRSGGELLLRHRLSVPDGGAESIERHLSAVLGFDVIVSLGVGSLRVNQKPILNVFNTDGRSVAFVKVGDNAVTRELVEREAKAIIELQTRSWAILRPPALLHFGTWNDLTLLVVSALRTPALPPLVGRLAAPHAAMAELADAYDEGESPLAETLWWNRLQETARALHDTQRSTQFVTALSRVQEVHGEQLVRVGAWHGDWTPWNMARSRGSVLLWDWERFELGVPVGLDRTHFDVSVASRKHGWTQAVLSDALGVGIRPSADRQAGFQALLYMAAIATRYLESEQGVHGNVIKQQANTALQTLVWMLDRRAGVTPAGGYGR